VAVEVSRVESLDCVPAVGTSAGAAYHAVHAGLAVRSGSVDMHAALAKLVIGSGAPTGCPP
jgi:hypothetical protein